MSSPSRAKRRPFAWLRGKLGRLFFERRYGVRTDGPVELGELGIATRERGYYAPASWRTLRRALNKRDIGERDVFIDFGSGMGRMVLEASRFPFNRVIGVELSAHLHRIACDNIARTRVVRRCGAIDLVRADAVDYHVPDDVTVAFFNNPFQGSVFDAVIRKLIASVDRNPRRVKVIYCNPVEELLLMRTGRFRRTRTVSRSWHSRGGDPFGSIRIYELLPRTS